MELWMIKKEEKNHIKNCSPQLNFGFDKRIKYHVKLSTYLLSQPVESP